MLARGGGTLHLPLYHRDGDGEDSPRAKYKRSALRRFVRVLRKNRRAALAVSLLSVVLLVFLFSSTGTAASSKLQAVRSKLQRGGSEAHAPAALNLMEAGSERQAPPPYCTQFPIYLDVGRPPSCMRPTVSIVFTTKRPGGIDILFHSLANQTSTDYELICIDELAQYRSTKMYDYARRLGVNLVAVVPSKPKMDRDMDKKFGIYKALNTGLLLASGDVIASVMDYAWLPASFVERTAEFYRRNPKSFLAYPVRGALASQSAPNDILGPCTHAQMMHIGLPDIRNRFIDISQLENPLALTVWKKEMTVPISAVEGAGGAGPSPSLIASPFARLSPPPPPPHPPPHPRALLSASPVPLSLLPVLPLRSRPSEPAPRALRGRSTAAPYYWRPDKAWQAANKDFTIQSGQDRYWELAHASAPWSAFEELNGYDEYLDSGDDCHEVNVRERAEILGYDLWIDGGSVVENVEHRTFTVKEKDPQWQRFAEDTNINLHWDRMGKIREKKEDIRSDNGWDLRTWRKLDCAKAIYGLKCPPRS
eukprot:tig00001021_g6303.t1